MKRDVFNDQGDHLGVTDEILPGSFLATGYNNRYDAFNLGTFPTELEARNRIKGWHNEP